MISESKITFYSGVGGATGANFVVRKNGKAFAVDCGLIQGGKFAMDENRDNFGYDPKEIDVLLITHSHMDHIGRIPKLVREGFSGVIYSTPQTKEIAEVMFTDALRLITREATESGNDPLYKEEDVATALNLWGVKNYHEKFEFLPGLFANFLDSGHILGSSIIEVSSENGVAVFTGDSGNSPTPLLPDTEIPEKADALIVESVYGDRNHESKEERDIKLFRVIDETIKKGGTVVIPSFSIERTQVILYELNDLIEKGKIKKVPVFVDSPLAIAVTSIYKRNEFLFNENVRNRLSKGDDIFEFPGLHFVRKPDESRAIMNMKSPKIIIAGSGMSVGGRVIQHEKHYLGDKNSTILLVGFQVPGSLGRAIEDGEKVLNIEGEKIRVHARIEKISGYSSHKDSNGIVDFVSRIKSNPKNVYVAMGEPKSSAFLAQRINDELDINAICPERGDTIDFVL